MKAQHERHDNCSLRIENDKIRCNNIVIQEALKNVICPNCGGLSVAEDSYFDEQKLKMENARLKDEDYTVEHESFVLCAVCSEYIYIFRHRCLVCGRVYCRNCVGMGMGEMTENVLTAWEEDLVQGKQILTKSHLNYYMTAQLFQHKYMLIKPKKMCFWITDSCSLTVKEVKHMPPFEILSLASAVADALQI